MVRKIGKKGFKGVIPNDKTMKVNQVELQHMIDKRMNQESLRIRYAVQVDTFLTFAYALRNVEGWGGKKITRILEKSLDYINDIHLENEKWGFTLEDVRTVVKDECKVDVIEMIRKSAEDFEKEYMKKFTRGKEKSHSAK